MGFLQDLLYYLVKDAPIFAAAAWLTIKLTFAALILGVVIGLFFALLKISNKRILNAIANLYITIIRGTPLIVQIFAIYFGLARIYDFGPFWSPAIALAIHNGAYIAEIFRGGIQSIDKGQMEAARSLGMPYPLAMRRIILPQAFKRVVPPLGNQFIIGLKDSSLAAFVTAPELFAISMRRAASTLADLEMYAIAGLYYLVMVIIFSFLVSKLEKKLNVDEA